MWWDGVEEDMESHGLSRGNTRVRHVYGKKIK